jgi:F-box and leucine-rich repeat protein 14
VVEAHDEQRYLLLFLLTLHHCLTLSLLCSLLPSLLVVQLPDHTVEHLYSRTAHYNVNPDKSYSPKTLAELATDTLCRHLLSYQGPLPPGLPSDVVDDIHQSLLTHKALTEGTLRALQHCEWRVLSLAGCRGVTDSWLTALTSSQHFKSLSSIECPSPDLTSTSSSFSESSLEPMQLDSSDVSTCYYDGSSSSSLETAQCDISEGGSIPPSPSPTLMDHHDIHSPCSTTQALTLLDLRGSTELSDAGLSQLGDLCQLQIARLDHCHRLTSLRSFANSHNLEVLSLSDCRRMSDRGILAVANLQSVQHVNLSGCRCLSDHGVSVLQHWHCLTHVDLSRCDMLTDYAVEYLKDLDQIEDLNLSWCRGVTDAGLEMLVSHLGRAENLRVLKIARCDITDKGLLHLAKLTMLEELDLNGCTNLTGAGLDAMLKLLPNLTVLDVSYCPGIL